MKRILILCTLYLVSLSLSAQAKYVFYFIGDGMGVNHVIGAEMYRSALEGESRGRVQTLMTQFPFSGMVATHSLSNEITDSSAAGTCLATGSKTNNGVLGLDDNGDTLTTIAEQLKREGWGVGIMTTVAIDHATPAAFYSHVPSRHDYYDIGRQLCESGFDFFGGAGFHHPQGENDDQEVNLYRLAEQSGYSIAHGYAEAQQMLHIDTPQSTRPKPLTSRLILVQSTDDNGAAHGSNLPEAIDRRTGDLTLTQIVQTAIPFLYSRHERFIMMVEGGMIDYACHGDDAATAIGEVWDMDEALHCAWDFYLAHPDETLIVVTADHETGGMGLGNGGKYTLHLDRLQHQKCSSWALGDQFSELFADGNKPTWEEVKQIYRTQLGLWEHVKISDEDEAELKEIYRASLRHKAKDTETLYKSIHALSDAGVKLLNKKAKIGWTSHGHTAQPVPVFAVGVGAERFSGWHDNTEIVPLIRRAIEE